jgi:predicted  nucleic acid-binding Zn-ribbon protein
MEEYIFEQFAANGGTLRAAIERARGLDYSYLPKSLQTDVLTGFEKAESAFELIATAKAAEAEIETQATDYRPLHVVVREIQNKILIVDTKIKIVEQQLRRAEPDSPLKEVREARMDALNGERDALLATMPENWDAAHKAFLSHTKAERTARNAYRKAVDAAYEPIVELRAIIADAAALEAMGDSVTALQADVPGLEFAPAIERIKAVENRINDVAGTREINKLLAKARRAIKGKTPDAEKAAQFLSDAAMAFDAEVAWRKRADAGLKNGLAEYDAAIRDTIGLRGQSRLPKEQALYVASCSAGHKDISLSF